MANKDQRTYIITLKEHIADVRLNDNEFPSQGTITLTYDIASKNFIATIDQGGISLANAGDGDGDNPGNPFP